MKNIILFLLLAAGTLFAQTSEVPMTATVDGYAARVNSSVITYGDVRESVAPMMPQLARRYQGEEFSEQVQQLMFEAREALIEEALLKEEVKTLNLTLPEHVMDDEIDRLIRERFNGDRALLTRALTAQRTTFDEWREDVVAQITMRMYYNREVIRRASVSAEAIKEAYEKNKERYFVPFKVKFSAILINKGASAEDKAVKKQQAVDVLEKLRNGADFSETAKEVSEGIRADDGGAFPWSTPDEIRAELRPFLYSVPTGEISELIETEEEFYIIKIDQRREEGYISLDDAREQIENEELAVEQRRLHKELIEQLSRRHFIERY